MSYKATCNDCDTIILGKDEKELSEMMLEHHEQARLDGSWTSAACGIFAVQEINEKDEITRNFWLEATMTAIIKPWTGELWYDTRKWHGKGKEIH